MTKTLAIIRHGKSTWDYSSIIDLDRPLKETGIQNTILIGNKIKTLKIIPELIISSHANRALHTANILARELKYPFEKIEINPLLYSDSEEDIIEWIKQTDSDINKLFLVGHNPTFTLLANHFISNKFDNLPTSGTVIIEFNCQKWNEISLRTNTKEITLFPKMLNPE